jgi:hypothetical protein
MNPVRAREYWVYLYSIPLKNKTIHVYGNAMIVMKQWLFPQLIKTVIGKP